MKITSLFKIILKLNILGILVLLLFSCQSVIRFSDNSTSSSARILNSVNSKNDDNALPSGVVIKGYASYYGDEFDGRKTANGDIFSQSKFTAAHKSFPFGTKVKVTNLNNGLSVVVIINDRGPFVRGRVIDLSKAAALIIDMVNSGVVPVEIVVIE